MSLNKDTLELILDNAAAARALPDTEVPLVALPVGVKLNSLEKFQAERTRFRGTLATSSLRDFSDYVVKRNGPAAKGFVDQSDMTALVFFNLGDEKNPGHGDDRALLSLKPTAAFTALQQLAGRKLSQKDLAEWIEDWRHNLIAVDAAGSTLEIVKAIAAVRNITIKASAERTSVTGNFSANNSSMDAIEAASQDTLPAELHFNIVPYEGLQRRLFILRLSVLTGDDKPTLKPRWVGEEAQREEITQEFKTVLAKEIGGAAALTLGHFVLAD